MNKEEFSPETNPPVTVEINKEFKKALGLLENTSKNVLITGRAGTGKSTLLDYFRRKTQKKVVVLAPTGVAAVNVKGETIHSFFGFKPNTTLEKIKKIKSKKFAQIYQKIDTIIIDEISMVRADLLDCVDTFLRLNGRDPDLPFGGIQMVFIGDLYQLPPVVLRKEKEIFNSFYKSSYFFAARAFEQLDMEFVELQKVYRQKDKQFIKLLSAIRNNTITEKELEIINQRVNPDIDLNHLDYYIYLTSTNKLAAKINHGQLDRIKAELHVYHGVLEGKFDEKYLPTDLELKIKVGSQVMLLNNDEYGRWVNGTIGRVVEIINREEEGEDIIRVELPEGNIEEVYPYKWELFHFQLNPKTKNLEAKVIGHFIQYPLKLAWAITIHKSQGKTFDRVIIDVSGGIFAYGQIYVALSRCRTLDGIILRRPIEKRHIFMDREIVDFITRYQYKISERDLPVEEKVKIINQAIEKNNPLKITYLKPNDEKSNRIIKPLRVGEMTYLDKPFLGVEAFCCDRRDTRVFRVDRILEIEHIAANLSRDIS
ncbi:MAG: AAA family ATPase [Caldiserica bacterium]|nr:AAA family ATPase [Caldisericota bacterium]